jgi:hypothetical protein
MSTPIFIVGVPRSGTTLLRFMLDSHPNLAAGPECPWIGGNYGNIVSFRDLHKALICDERGPVLNFSGLSESVISSALGKAISDILGTYAAARGKKRWIEKTPNHITEIPFLIKLFPKSKYIHIVRDGRDVACSSFAERKTWGSYLINRDDHIPNTRINAMKRWLDWVNQFEKWCGTYELDVLQIHYERLVTRTVNTLQLVLDFIDEPWSDDIYHFKDQCHDSPHWEAGSRDVNERPYIIKSSIGRWKWEFTLQDREFSAKTIESYLLKFGYEPTFEVSHSGTGNPSIDSLAC